MDLGRVGIWSGQLRRCGQAEAAVAAQELEQLGFAAVWLPGAGEGLFDRVRELLSATRRLVVATGILSIWTESPSAVAAAHHALVQAYPGRFLLGLGVSHAPLVDRENPGRYRRPLEAMGTFLDGLDATAPPVPPAERALAALGPRMLTLARERAAGAHPYLVPPSHTRRAREVLGPGPLLAPEQAVVLASAAVRARQIARAHLGVYLQLPNYTNNLRREGFTAADFAEGGSDRLVDGLVAWGEPAAVLARVREHHNAGADHVCIQVLTEEPQAVPVAQWRALAQALAT